MLERDIRQWLRRAWGKSLRWAEAAPGGSPGMPDVFLPIGGAYIPVELKRALEKPLGWRCDIRPSQIRYHHLAALDGVRTAFIIGIHSGREDKAAWSAFAFPGSACPQDGYIGLGMTTHFLGWSSDNPVEIKRRLLETFTDRRFWDRRNLDGKRD